ncbi:MAG: class I SAM-dependent methyltransferase [Candidatus Eremiobacteraeota bacterium]|nr:class I SAM-dependent methyltransferase [Candidatus Eremiobacteraeota bacterium]MBV9972280.1 class I SAM-dependent methyltransferase [Candidatus Eremiobacteraeota bacterium]
MTRWGFFTDLRSIGVSATRKKDRVLERLTARCKRLIRRDPVVVPNPNEAEYTALRDETSPFHVKCSTIVEFRQYVMENPHILSERERFEKSLLPKTNYFSVVGYCAVCDRATTFAVDYLYADGGRDGERIPNWRERLICRSCKLPNRQRAIIDFLESESKLTKPAALYVTEHASPFFRALRRRYPKAIGSELLNDGTPLGASNALRIRNEDLTQLTFSDDSFDAICATDVLEHVPDYQRALSECFRCLRSGGTLIVSVPFLLNSEQTLVRARVRPDDTVEHILPPEYHGDPLDPHGVLCYYHFGWDLLQSMNDVGFSNSALCFYWSWSRGYLGATQFLIETSKP